MSTPIRTADFIPISTSTPVVVYAPVVLPMPGRPVNLEIKVSAPATGHGLPIILLSHGHGNSNFLSSLRGYGPLADFYAAHGFAVIQPTHLDSKTLGLDTNGSEGPLFWKSRALEMHHILDHLDEIEVTVPGLDGRLDRNRIAVVGHSLGGQTAGLLLGMQVRDPNDGSVVNLTDARVKAGVLLGAPGGSAGATGPAVDRYPVLRGADFSTMTAPTLVVAGDRDVNPMFSDRADWRSDAYTLSPDPKSLLTVYGGGHMLGGISGYDAAETDDENPERADAVGRLTWAYLRSTLYPEDHAWDAARAALQASPSPLAKVEFKPGRGT